MSPLDQSEVQNLAVILQRCRSTDEYSITLSCDRLVDLTPISDRELGLK